VIKARNTIFGFSSHIASLPRTALMDTPFLTIKELMIRELFEVKDRFGLDTTAKLGILESVETFGVLN
jgi:hypothetical protein